MSTSTRARRWGSVLAVLGTLVVLAAAAAWYLFPVQYEAYALLRVASKPPTVLDKEPADETDFAIFKRTQVQLLLSNVVLNGALREPDINRLSIVRPHMDDPVSWLKGQLLIDYPDDAEIMRVALWATNPGEAQKLVDKAIEVYLREVVQHDKQLRMDNEDKLRRAFEKLSADYQRELEALRTLESIHKTTGSEAAQLKKKMAIEELNSFVARRDRLRDALVEVGQEIAVSKASKELPDETRTAEPPGPSKAETAGLPLAVLEEKERYLQEQVAKVDDQIKKMTDEVAVLDSFSAQVAAKQEELTQLRLIKNQLSTELDRLNVERLAPERITLVDKAVIDDNRGDALARHTALALAGGVGLTLIGLGLLVRLARVEHRAFDR